MILSDRDIKKYLEEGRLVVEPKPDEKQIQPAWIDVKLGNKFRIFDNSGVVCLDPKKTGDCTKLVEISDDKPFILHPNEFVLGMVHEYIKLPDDLAAAIDGRSSLGRMGVLVHLTSTFINPGWAGNLVLEMINIGKVPVVVYPGMRICKIVFMKLSSPAEKPYDKRDDTKYQEQRDIISSKLDKEFI